MATGIMQISPARFTGALAATLPVYIPSLPVAGATHVWDARTIRANPGAAVSSWSSHIGTTTLTPEGSRLVDATAPVLAQSVDGALAVRFDGTRKTSLGAAMTRTMPNTVVAIAKANGMNPGVLSAIVGSGPTTALIGQVLAFSDNGVPRTYAGTSLSLPLGRVGTDVYHVFISVFNGESSVIQMDGEELVGPAGDMASTVISLGGYAANFGSMDIKMVAYYPFAMTAAQRATTVAKLTV